MEELISVTEAKQVLQAHTSPLKPVKKKLKDAANHVLAENVVAPFDIPAFRQSSVDGYAIRFEDLKNDEPFVVTGESAAGDNTQATITEQQAYRIFTGAPVPEGADTIIMQERTLLDNASLIINDRDAKMAQHLRAKGSEIAAGTIALQSGTFMTPAATGFLAGIGISEILVYPSPVVSIILTGNELVDPGQSLLHGQVYESNSFGLSAVLDLLHLQPHAIHRVGDDLDALTAALAAAIASSDIVLLTGGVSVGDYDFVLKACEANGVATLFHGVKQRPGKPLYAGMVEHKLLFGLPGNPSSVLTCFYEYVLPVIGGMRNDQRMLAMMQVPLSGAISKNTGLTHFMKAEFNGTAVTVAGAQESYRMSSFATANCIVVIPEGEVNLTNGDIVEVHFLNI